MPWLSWGVVSRLSLSTHCICNLIYLALNLHLIVEDVYLFIPSTTYDKCTMFCSYATVVSCHVCRILVLSHNCFFGVFFVRGAGIHPTWRTSTVPPPPQGVFLFLQRPLGRCLAYDCMPCCEVFFLLPLQLFGVTYCLFCYCSLFLLFIFLLWLFWSPSPPPIPVFSTLSTL